MTQDRAGDMFDRKSTLGLVSVLHDPQGRQLTAIRKYIDDLKQMYSQIAVVATKETSPEVIEELHHRSISPKLTGRAAIGRSRREALSLGLAFDSPNIHYCDFDRILHWVRSHPKDLENALEQIERYEFVVIGRTRRAFETHPKVQQEIERITNYVFSLTIGEEMDPTAGSCAMSRKTAELILKHSKASTNATDTEWPMIVRLLSDAEIGFLKVEGLEFETADYYPEEIRSAGSLERWIELSYDTLVDVWHSRVKLALDSIEAMLAVGDSPEVKDGPSSQQ